MLLKKKMLYKIKLKIFEKRHNMKKIILALILILFLVGCKEIPEEKPSLSELQVAACDAADEAETCDTRLIEVGIVMPNECCEVLDKCC